MGKPKENVLKQIQIIDQFEYVWKLLKYDSMELKQEKLI